MLVHSFTLHALCREISPILFGSEILEIFSQARNELLISVRQESTTEKGALTVCVCVEPNFNYIVVREEFSRKRKNSIDLFRPLQREVISTIAMHSSDRIILLETRSGEVLQFHLYNTAESNILLVRDGRIVQAFKRNKSLAGTPVPASAPVAPEESSLLGVRISQMLPQSSESSIDDALRKLLPHFGKWYVREICTRGGVDAERAPNTVSEEDCLSIASAIQSILHDLEHPEPRLYEQKDGGKLFSVIPLHQMSPLPYQTCSSVNEGILESLRSRFRKHSMPFTKASLERAIRRDLERAQQALGKISGDRHDDAATFEQWGNLLLAHLAEIRKGTSQVEVPNIYAGDEPLLIRLDPRLTPPQNAERYFDRAKKIRHGTEEVKRRRSSLEHQIGELNKLAAELETCTTDEQYRQFLSNHKEAVKRMQPVREQTEEENLPFRVFAVTGGMEVWVGKSSSSNDLLTMKYAKPNDYWFHVRGASGSHTVLRVVDRSKPVPKETIREAAAIAAYYSKMRRGSNVPVAYCERKYVRKTKGLKEGAVVMEREKIVFVHPALP